MNKAELQKRIIFKKIQSIIKSRIKGKTYKEYMGQIENNRKMVNLNPNILIIKCNWSK